MRADGHGREMWSRSGDVALAVVPPGADRHDEGSCGAAHLWVAAARWAAITRHARSGSSAGMPGGHTAGKPLPLDRDVDHRAPLGPRPVVVAHAGVAEQLVEHEPGVAGALADTAVGDDVLVGRHALALVERAQLLGALEPAVLAHRPPPAVRPGQGGGPGGGAPALGGLGRAWRRDDLPARLGGRAHVPQRDPRL